MYTIYTRACYYLINIQNIYISMSAIHRRVEDIGYFSPHTRSGEAGDCAASPLDRIEALAGKLEHAIPDVRARAASSLLFKLNSGVLSTSDLARNPDILCSVAAHLHRALRGVLDGDDGGRPQSSTPQSTIRADHDELRSLLRLCVHLATASRASTDLSSNVGVPEALSQVLDVLFAMSARPSLDAALGPAIAEVM
jgi:hypothetical protein